MHVHVDTFGCESERVRADIVSSDSYGSAEKAKLNVKSVTE